MVTGPLWSPIRSIIIRVINKIGRPRSGSPICLITSMITDRIGRHEVLLPINHNFNKISKLIGYIFCDPTKTKNLSFTELPSSFQVLQRLGYVDANNVVQLKGRVACEISNHELIITELVFENAFTDLHPTEIVALLSCFVFQQVLVMSQSWPK